MMLRTLIVSSLILSISAPALACGPDVPPVVSTAAEDADPMARALVVTGSAVSIDNRQRIAPVLYLAYPMLPGQTHQTLYGAFFNVVRDRNFRVLSNRIRKHQMPRVLLTRESAAANWHIAALLPRG